ncbi:hypothetical protein SAMN05192568_105511 [Methylobacterium pseudosasicola]|uniref:Uncharacterized protein n=2 Tax=Methylobacterium pseudosasicola TaxID=582667 RepID=A0A1I4TLA2_9HYPH|nr:hypothetical protein SAMN05192568_105511 [Methylobacterium pseudosasicola]
MSYTVEITIAEPASTDEEVETRMYQLPDPYETVANAKEAAAAHIASLDLEPAVVIYSVFDREGFTVASSVEELAEAG